MWPPEIWQVLRRHRLNERTRRLRKSTGTATLGHRTSDGCIEPNPTRRSKPAREEGLHWPIWSRPFAECSRLRVVAQGSDDRPRRRTTSAAMLGISDRCHGAVRAERGDRSSANQQARSSLCIATIVAGECRPCAGQTEHARQSACPILYSHKVYYGIYRYSIFTRDLRGIQKVKPAKCVQSLRAWISLDDCLGPRRSFVGAAQMRPGSPQRPRHRGGSGKALLAPSRCFPG